MNLTYEWIFVLFLVSVLLLAYFFHKKIKSLSYEILERNQNNIMRFTESILNQQYLRAKEDLEHRQKSIEELVSPIKQVIEKLSDKTHDIEKKREVAYVSIHQQIQHLIESEKELKKQTYNLNTALKSPNIRGSWGQVHLKRVVELAGLLEHCDFYEQKTVEKDGKVYRPDLLVRMPSEKYIVIDSKAPMDSYFSAIEESDPDKKEKYLKDHAKQLRRHVKMLSSKEYHRQFSLTPEYVILFLPAESFFSAAVKSDPKLIEISAEDNIVIATPTTLIAILRVVAQVWKEDKVTENTIEIAKLGSELYERINTLAEHWAKLGKSINLAVDSYNSATSSLKTRLIPTARKLKDQGVSSLKDISLENVIEKKAKDEAIWPNE